MNSLIATRSMVRALVGMTRGIGAARKEISSSSFSLFVFEDLVEILIRCRSDIEDTAVSLESLAEAAAAGRDATEVRRLRVRFRCLKLMAKAWRLPQEEFWWNRYMEQCYDRSTAKKLRSLKGLAATACRRAEQRVAQLPEPQVSAAEEAPAVVDDAEGTALADFRAMADALLAIGRREDAMEDSEEYRGILRGMERLFSSA